MLRKKTGFGANGGFALQKKVFLGIEQIVKKKDGVGANGGFDFTKKVKEMLGKRWGLEQTVDLILYRNRTNCEEKIWGWSQRWI